MHVFHSSRMEFLDFHNFIDSSLVFDFINDSQMKFYDFHDFQNSCMGFHEFHDFNDSHMFFWSLVVFVIIEWICFFDFRDYRKEFYIFYVFHNSRVELFDFQISFVII